MCRNVPCNLPAPGRQSLVEHAITREAAMLDAMVQGFFLPAAFVVGVVFFAVLAIIMLSGTRGA